MISSATPSSVGLLFSGGLDSAIMLGHLLSQGHTVRPFYVRSRLAWETAELPAVHRFLRAMASRRLEPLVVLDLPLSDLYDGHWSLTGRQVPDAATPDEAVYLPGRNPLLLIKPALWCQLHGVRNLALALLGSNPFADASAEFFSAFEAAMNHATAGGVKIVRPFEQLHKRDVMQLGAAFPLGLTFSCIDPVEGQHCGQCNKCAERQAAFRLLDADDPTRYVAGGRWPTNRSNHEHSIE